jgi:hypothetical protein
VRHFPDRNFGAADARPALIATISAVVIAGMFLLAFAAGARAATPEYVASFGTYTKPSAVGIDEIRGYVFVADSGANVVQIAALDGSSPAGLASTTIEGFAFNGEPTGVAVDNSSSPAAGTVYVADVANSAIKKFAYDAANEAYVGAGELSASPGFSEPVGVAVDAEGNIYVADYGSASIIIFDPTGAETGRIETGPYFGPPSSVAVDAAGDVFVESYEVNAVYKFAASSVGEVEPGTTPTQLSIDSGEVSGVAVNPATNIVYVARGDQVTEFDATTLDEIAGFGSGEITSTERLAANSATGALYVTDPAAGHVDLFELPAAKAPEVVTLPVGPVTASTAVIGGLVDPNSASTTYYLEYASTADFSDAVSVPTTEDGDAGSGDTPVHVSRVATGLAAGTTYFFRVVAENAEGGPVIGAARSFTTLSEVSTSCPNEEFRTGPSVRLPDCRAYELVTPVDTNAAMPLFALKGDEIGAFDTLPIAMGGESVIFNLTGGALPGTNGTGAGDLYRATRGSSGWSTSGIGPDASQTKSVGSAGVSDEHDYAFWEMEGEGTLAEGAYVRNPDGSFDLLGDGSLADDPDAVGRWISPGGAHIIFTSQIRLEEEAPAAVGPGTPFFVASLSLNTPVDAVYDRTPTGLEVVSLLPGDQTPPPGSTTYYRGYSADGSAVVFNVDGTMYIRRAGETYPIVTTASPGDLTFEGVSRDGQKVFYLLEESAGGELFVFDLANQENTQISAATDARVVNVSADGSHVYFVSAEVLGGVDAREGDNNLYAWSGSGVEFIAALPEADEDLWRPGWALTLGVPQQNNSAGPVEEPSRTTPDGSVIVFESSAALTSYDNDGHVEIYRYAQGEGLTCISCSPSGAPALGDALLQGDSRVFGTAPTNGVARIPNVTDDGRAVFFNTTESLVSQDTDGVRDVYEWKEGRISLISYGHSGGSPEWLYGMTRDGHDVLFTSNSGLVPQKPAGTLAIYDGRVGGGYPPPPLAAPCVGEACQGPPPAPVGGSPIGTAQFVGPGNARRPGCQKKQRKAKCACKKQRPKRCKRAAKRKQQKRTTNSNRRGR